MVHTQHTPKPFPFYKLWSTLSVQGSRSGKQWVCAKAAQALNEHARNPLGHLLSIHWSCWAFHWANVEAAEAGTECKPQWEEQEDHIINKKRNGRQMSSLICWLILYSISAVCRGIFQAKLKSIKYMSQILFHLSWWSSGRVQSQLSEGHRFKSHHISMNLFLKLCLTITPPSPSSCIK